MIAIALNNCKIYPSFSLLSEWILLMPINQLLPIINCQLTGDEIFLKIKILNSSNDDLKPSTVNSEQSPTGLIARHIKITGL